jgi:autotransporter translocation and assembly factor TamB
VSSQLGFVYPIPIDEDTVDSTELTIDSQTTATVITDNSEAVSRTPKNTSLSNASVTTTRTPHVETNATDVDLSMPNDLASRKDAPNSQNISTLDDKNDKPVDVYDARLLNETPGEFLFCLFSFTAQPCRTENNSGIRFVS